MSALPLVIAALLAADADGDGDGDGDGFRKVDEAEGVRIEEREVKGSSWAELRFTATVEETADRLCAAAFSDGKFDAKEPGLKTREVLEEKDHERITHDVINTPVFSDREYVAQTRREKKDDGSCEVRVGLANDRVDPIDGLVRVPKLGVLWRFTPSEAGKTKITYQIHTEAGGSIPAFMATGSRRKLGVQWLKLIVDRAKALPSSPPPAVPDAGRALREEKAPAAP
ncbi:MAG TPA: hypothetical protein VGK67_38310 [Myxococcales bacterium]|jgi:hypothetical protein